MPIDEHNLISTDSLGQNIFACLYKGHGLFILRLLQRDGSIVDPKEAGFKMRNMTWSRDNRAYGGGDGSDIHFVLLKTDRYSLLLKGKEVWTFGPPTVMGLGLSPAAEAERASTFQSILDFMGRHGPEPPASYIAGASTQTNKQVVFLREGDMGVPWDPKLFPLNKY